MRNFKLPKVCSFRLPVTQRQAHLHQLVNLSRFLIRPSVRCPNLASQVLKEILARLPEDFEQRYHYRSCAVEAFVEERQEVSCFPAGDLVCVGKTKGRGRQDRGTRSDKTIKKIFLLPLGHDWREPLGVPSRESAPVLEPGEGLNSEEWAENEGSQAALGDRRLTKRFVKCVSLLVSTSGEANHRLQPGQPSGYSRLLPVYGTTGRIGRDGRESTRDSSSAFDHADERVRDGADHPRWHRFQFCHPTWLP